MTGALRTGDAMTGALQAGALRTSFAKFLKALVKDQSVPADIPWAVPWAELEKTMKVPASVKRLRGKLNVPRERFRTTTAMQYVGAGRKL
ncbi:MAG: hypothetical protein FJ272_22655 [Planctomycetes bacterium]|nr:hypothetical protein [Planctomycetota bacterium]